MFFVEQYPLEKVLLINSAEQIYSKQFLIGKDWMIVITEPLAVELE